MNVEYYAQLEEILLPNEMPFAHVFLDIMTEIAQGMAGGEQPSPLDWVFARSQAAAIWRYNRQTSDGKAFAASLGLQSFSMQQQTAFRDADARVRLKKAHLEDIREARAIHAELKLSLLGEAPAKPKGRHLQRVK